MQSIKSDYNFNNIRYNTDLVDLRDRVYLQLGVQHNMISNGNSRLFISMYIGVEQ